MEVLENPGFLMSIAVIQAALMILLIRFVDLYEREPLAVLGVMALWGATGAAMIAAVANTALLRLLSEEEDLVFGNAIFPPAVEETSKGIALVVAFAVSHVADGHLGVFEFHGLTDGLVYGAAVGIGFGFTEDFFKFADEARRQGIEAGFHVFVTRRDFFGPAILHHALFTGAFGAALGVATWFWSRGWAVRFGLPVLGLAVAIAMHAVNNGLVELRLVYKFGLVPVADWIKAGRPAGAIDDAAAAPVTLLQLLDWVYIAILILAAWFWLAYQRDIIRDELREEIDRGLISREEWEQMPRYWRRSKRYWQLLWDGDIDEWVRVKHLHHDLADLAFLKWRAPSSPRVDRCRRRIEALQTFGPD